MNHIPSFSQFLILVTFKVAKLTQISILSFCDAQNARKYHFLVFQSSQISTGTNFNFKVYKIQIRFLRLFSNVILEIFGFFKEKLNFHEFVLWSLWDRTLLEYFYLSSNYNSKTLCI